MPAPTVDPIILQVLNAVVTAMGAITQANGFYNNVAGVGIEPLAFGPGDTYPQLVVQEEASTVFDSNASGYAETATIAVHGFIPIAAATGYATALKLGNDITRVLQSITAKTFINAAGKQLVRGWALGPQREIVKSDLAESFLEVIVRATADYRDFPPPVSGI